MSLPAWLEQALPELLIWGTALSLGTLLAVIVIVPFVISRLPSHYFNEPKRHPLREQVGGASQWLFIVIKNLMGALLVLLGLLMLFTPGQGLLTLLAGLLLMNFPGKYRLERALVSRESVMHALNWFRERQGRPPFDPPNK
ncbi:PGPGW domain-containing protein [Pseudohalioglobus lutimaris]|uniref:Transmembrane protein (PGPGW) n=1 Tax=Pseudohalioglobus lutimaris TaxID=1737061 RepID=A0A2N5X588_9GAMM|nr:hypothetical protein [Pseudohalioglobus lutimaris]PLW69655.1 hypothetical protein C0039_06500 [Pseudohalioglobus lutimaris]